MNSQLGIDDIKAFIRRRQTICLVTFSVIFACAIILAAVLPPIYRSEATIRISEPQISDDFIKPVYEITPEERLQTLTNSIMSNTNLGKVIKEYNLYPELRERGAMNQAISKIRGAIEITPSHTSVMNPRTGRSIPITSAIIVSFEGRIPEQVKNVTQALSNLYIEEDVKRRGERASATTQFLEGEIDRLKGQIEDQETKLNNFKKEHAGELPQDTVSNLQIIARLERDLDEAENSIKHLQKRKIDLNGRLSTVAPLAPIKTGRGDVIRDPNERLKGLKMELMQLQTYLSDKHPDIIRAKREIAELENQLGNKTVTIDKSQLINRKRAELTKLEEQYGEKHPDVIRLKEEINRLSNENSRNNSMRGYGYQRPDNPAYIEIQTQIEEVDAELRSQMESKERISSQLGTYKSHLNNAPIVETRYNELARTLENTKKSYNELTSKLMDARVSQAIEQKDRGTKFTLTDPAYLPNKSYKPNRLAIVALGFIAALGTGLGLAAAKEFTDNSIKSEKELSEVINIPVLSTIPMVGKEKKKLRNYT